jgi:ParB family transcriptional regulator, chromosome partitioning protein
LILQGFPAHFSLPRKRRDQTARILILVHLEFHQLDRRWANLRVQDATRQRRLLASLAEGGQQTPIIVVKNNGVYLVIDGHKRIAALQQLGRDTIDATVWEMSEADALLLSRTMRLSPQESALEQGWLLSEMEQRFHYSLDELAHRFDRSPSWVSRRLALVDVLPEAIQQHVRQGKIVAQVAMKYLVPVARTDADACLRLATIFIELRCDSRAAQQLYAAWRQGSRTVRERILAEPELFLKTQRQQQPQPVTPTAVEQVERDLEMALAILRRASKRLNEAMAEMNVGQRKQMQYNLESARRELKRMTERTEKEQEPKDAEPSPTNHDSRTPRPGHEPARDCTSAETLAPERAQSTPGQLDQCAGDSAHGKSRAVPRPDSGTPGFVQGEPRASP